MLNLPLPTAAMPGESPIAALLGGQPAGEPGVGTVAPTDFGALLEARANPADPLFSLKIPVTSSPAEIVISAQVASAPLAAALPVVLPALSSVPELLPAEEEPPSLPASGKEAARTGKTLPPAPAATLILLAPLPKPARSVAKPGAEQECAVETVDAVPAAQALVPALSLAPPAQTTALTAASGEAGDAPAGKAPPMAVAAPVTAPAVHAARQPATSRTAQPEAAAGGIRFAAAELAARAESAPAASEAAPRLPAVSPEPAAIVPQTAPANADLTAQPDAPAGTAEAALRRPADLAAVVDAIARARAEARPDTVAMTVRHVDFGPVSLRFEHHRGELTVAMTSPDPDFARAVSAATSAEATQAQGDAPRGETARQDSSRSEQPGRQAGGDLSGQSRSAPERREPSAIRNQPEAAARGQASSGDEPAADSGIFA